MRHIVYLTLQLRKHSCKFVQHGSVHRGVRGGMLVSEGGEWCPLLASALNFKGKVLLSLTDIKRLSNSAGANAYFDVIGIQHSRNQWIGLNMWQDFFNTSSYVTNDHVQAQKLNGNVKWHDMQPSISSQKLMRACMRSVCLFIWVAHLSKPA